MSKIDKELDRALRRYVEDFEVKGKGPLSVVLVLTRTAKEKKAPFNKSDFLTQEGGQVAGLGRSAVQTILKDYGIEKVLAEEGGRTSRGSIRRMQTYIELLNQLQSKDSLDLDRIEKWWIERIVEHFSSQPLKVKIDASKSLGQLVIDLMDSAYKRQQSQKGTMIAGAVMQHLVGAKLATALPAIEIEQNGFSVADELKDSKGDFVLGSCAIHVTTAPTESLIRKCKNNIAHSLRPIIITTNEGLGGAKALAKSQNLEDRIEIFEISQFISLNVYEWSKFDESSRALHVNELVERYNRIIEESETDHSLKIELG